MTSYAAVIPLLVIAVVATLIVRAALRNRIARPRPARPVRQPRRKNTTLRVVSHDQMDADLQDLIRKS